MSTPFPNLMSRKEVLAALDVSPGTLDRHGERLGRVNLDGRHYYDRQKVEAMAAELKGPDVSGLMTCAEVARHFGVTVGAVRLRDAELQPVMVRHGFDSFSRYYEPARILEIARREEAERISRANRRAGRKARKAGAL